MSYHKMKYSQQAILALAGLRGVFAWGSLGHQTIAYIAQHYVAESTETWAQSILNDTSSSYLANIATWADSYRYTAEGEFSAAFHYIDANDDPPNSCNVDYERDCSNEGCVVSAIANYTQRVQATNLEALQRNYALRWIVHFCGDVSQPLHDEAYEIGGNGIDVTFDGDETNLHAVWDTSIPEELRGGYGLEEAARWANDLVADIDTGKYANQSQAWLEGVDISDPISTAMIWARDGNSYVCSVVMPESGESYNGTELYPEYYNSAVETVERQIAKAGYRLGAYLDAIAANQTFDRRSIGLTKQKTVESDRWNLPLQRQGLTKAQRARIAKGDNGCGCSHEHGHQEV